MFACWGQGGTGQVKGIGLQYKQNLAAREMWDEAAGADGEGSIRAQAVPDWRPSTRTRYRSAISQLVETERQRPDLGLQEVLAESLAVR